MSTQVAAAWESTELVVMPYKDVKDLYILGDVSELIAALDESLVTVNTVLGSRYVGGIRDFVETWRKNLILFQDTLDEWLACQRADSASVTPHCPKLKFACQRCRPTQARGCI